MAKKEIVDGIATIDGKNVFANVETLNELAGAFAGFSSMCWESPEKAGYFSAEDASAGTNAFQERANDLIKAKVEEFVKALLKQYDGYVVTGEYVVDRLNELNLWT